MILVHYWPYYLCHELLNIFNYKEISEPYAFGFLSYNLYIILYYKTFFDFHRLIVFQMCWHITYCFQYNNLHTTIKHQKIRLNLHIVILFIQYCQYRFVFVWLNCYINCVISGRYEMIAKNFLRFILESTYIHMTYTQLRYTDRL